MRRILYWLGLVDLVWAIESDNEHKLRIVYYDHDTGERFVWRTNEYSQRYRLYADGSVSNVAGVNTSIRAWRAYPSPKQPRSGRLTMRRPSQADRVKWRLLGTSDSSSNQGSINQSAKALVPLVVQQRALMVKQSGGGGGGGHMGGGAGAIVIGGQGPNNALPQ